VTSSKIKHYYSQPFAAMDLDASVTVSPLDAPAVPSAHEEAAAAAAAAAVRDHNSEGEELVNIIIIGIEFPVS